MQASVYRVDDRYYVQTLAGSTPVHIELAAGMRLVGQQWTHEALIYGPGDFGAPIPTAIELGWCRIVTAPE